MIVVYCLQWTCFFCYHAIHGDNKQHFDEMMMMSTLHWTITLTLISIFSYNASSLKQESAGRHVAPCGYFILIKTKSIFGLTPWCCVITKDAIDTSFSLCFDPNGVQTYDLQHPMSLLNIDWLIIFLCSRLMRRNNIC